MTLQLIIPNNMTVDELLHYERYREAGEAIDHFLSEEDISWAIISEAPSKLDDLESGNEKLEGRLNSKTNQCDELEAMLETAQSVLDDVEAELKDLKANGAEVDIELEARIEHLQSVICNSEHTGNWSWQR